MTICQTLKYLGFKTCIASTRQSVNQPSKRRWSVFRSILHDSPGLETTEPDVLDIYSKRFVFHRWSSRWQRLANCSEAGNELISKQILFWYFRQIVTKVDGHEFIFSHLLIHNNIHFICLFSPAIHNERYIRLLHSILNNYVDSSGSVVVTAYDSESGHPGSSPEWGLIYYEASITAQGLPEPSSLRGSTLGTRAAEHKRL